MSDTTSGSEMPFPFNATGMTPEEIIKRLSEMFNQTVVVIEGNSTLAPRTSHVATDEGAEQFARAKGLVVVYLWCTLVASIIGVLGNSLVIAVGVARRSLLTNCKLLILHLAVCDMLSAVVQLLLVGSKFSNETWQLGGTFGCKVIRGATQMGSIVAIGTVLFIAIERYRGIVMPLKRRISQRGMMIGLGVTWFMAFLATVPALVHLKVSQTGYCEKEWTGLSSVGPKTYSLVLLVLFFMIPMLVIAVLYGGIINVLKQPLAQKLPGAGNMNAQQLKSRRRDDIRIVTILAFVVVMFAVCVLPLRLFWVIMEFEQHNLSAAQYVTLNFFGLIPYPYHVAVNPLIYSAVDRNFRKGVRALAVQLWHRLRNTKPTGRKSVTGSTEVQQMALVGFNSNHDESKY